MAMTKKNIIVGAARVFLGPSTSETANLANSKPAFVAGTRYLTTITGAPAVTAGWREVGFTQDGLEVATDPSWGEVEVDQLLDSAKIFKDGMSLSISTTMAEATLENLLMAWGQAATTLTSSGSTVNGAVPAGDKELDIDGGSLGEAPLERGLVAIGNAPEQAAVNAYGERVYQAYRVLSVEATSIANSRAEATTIPVTFRALPADNGRYGSVRDRMSVS